VLPTNDKERKALPILTFLTRYFPDAILAMVRVSVAGNIQHNPELAPADIKWAREKSTDQMNTAFRHMWDHATGTKLDSDGQYHLAKAAWRLLAELQLTIECDQTAARLSGISEKISEALGLAPAGYDAQGTMVTLEAARAEAKRILHGSVDPASAAAASAGYSPHKFQAYDEGRAEVRMPGVPLELTEAECQHGYTVCRVCQFP